VRIYGGGTTSVADEIVIKPAVDIVSGNNKIMGIPTIWVLIIIGIVLLMLIIS